MQDAHVISDFQNFVYVFSEAKHKNQSIPEVMKLATDIGQLNKLNNK